MDRLNGRLAVVTGAARGMGAATAKRFVEEGAQVLIADVLLPGSLWRSDSTGLGFAYAFGIQPLMHLSLCPDKPILAGLLESFAQYPLPPLAGRHDAETLYA